MRVYATESDLSQWMTPEPLPENPAGLLRAASYLIRRETLLARYKTVGGQPADPEVRDAFKDATTEQARWWAANDVDPARSSIGSGKVVASKTIKGASVSYDTGAAAAAQQARADAADTLAPLARQILADAGLLGGAPVIV